MSKLHDPNLNDDEKNLYLFPKRVVSIELINALNAHYADMYGIPIDKAITEIALVPHNPYFLDAIYTTNWVYIEKISITQEQVRKYLLLFNVTGLSFLEYIEVILEDKS